MLITITTTHRPATDLGYLLAKHPDRLQSFPVGFGQAHVFYPEVSEERCTAALLLEVDPVGLVRGRQGPSGEGRMLEQYVNDRPYVASSFTSVAMAAVFRSAMAGKCRERPELARADLPLEATMAVLPCRGSEDIARRLFEPLGYQVSVSRHALDQERPEMGESPYHSLTLRAACRLSELLAHLYVLIPVLDREKHYWVGEAEVEKLLRHGEGWLASHPERESIARRYLKQRGSLVRLALARLVEEEDPEFAPDPAADEALPAEREEGAVERPLRLQEARLRAVLEVLQASGARRVLDLGCGEGDLMARLVRDASFTEVTGVDASHRSLEVAASRLRLDRLPEARRERVRLLHGALTYRDRRLAGYDAAAVVEVIEHLDLPRLSAFERVLFEHARPGMVVVTTPNADYNVRWPSLPAGALRHRDHRFEWGRERFREWAHGVAGRFGYTARFLPVGAEDPEVGPPTQMAVFTRVDPGPGVPPHAD